MKNVVLFPATEMPDADWWGALWPRPAEVLAALGVHAELEVVDLCCGDGLFTAALALMTRSVIAIDLDPSMLTLAQAKVAAAGATNCNFIEGDAYDAAELIRRPVDFVLMANTFHGVPDKLRLARAVAAILKPTGRCAIVNWHRRPREETPVMGRARGPQTALRMGPADVAAAIGGAGLAPVRVVEIPPYHYGAIFDKLSAERP